MPPDVPAELRLGNRVDAVVFVFRPMGMLSALSTASNNDFDTLDRFGRIKSQVWKKTSTLDQVDYTYDYAGNRTTRNIVAATSLNQAYTYDDLHRLKSMVATAGNETWALDAWGNWSSMTATGAGSTTLTMSHNGANEVTVLNGLSTHVAHDGAGNMTMSPKPGNVTAHYDMVYEPWNRLVKVKDGAATVADYKYDGDHRRIAKVVSGVTYDYYYNYQVVEVRKNGSANSLERYTWHPYYVDALAFRYYDVNTDGTGDEQFATHDGNFNVTSLVNASGTVIERYNYKPYGKLDVLNASYVSIGSTTVENPYTYTGRRFDAETKLYYYRNRFYDSQLGRFITRDPIGYEGSKWNLYEYINGNPIRGLDPSGKIGGSDRVDDDRMGIGPNHQNSNNAPDPDPAGEGRTYYFQLGHGFIRVRTDDGLRDLHFGPEYWTDWDGVHTVVDPEYNSASDFGAFPVYTVVATPEENETLIDVWNRLDDDYPDNDWTPRNNCQTQALGPTFRR